MYSQQMHLGNVLVFQSQCVKDAKSLLPTLTYSYRSGIKLFCQLLLPDFENPGLVLNSWTLVSSLQMLLWKVSWSFFWSMDLCGWKITPEATRRDMMLIGLWVFFIFFWCMISIRNLAANKRLLGFVSAGSIKVEEVGYLSCLFLLITDSSKIWLFDEEITNFIFFFFFCRKRWQSICSW